MLTLWGALAWPSEGLGETRETYLTWACHINLCADTDRNGRVELGFDDWGEDRWEYGPNGRGAIVLANSDDDDGDHLPDNWIGGDFDYLPGEEGPDEVVNAFPDEEDLAPLIVPKLSLRSFPSEAKIVLRVARPADEGAPFAAIAPQERIRIFLPTHKVGDDLVVQPGDRAIIGPTAGDRAEFVPSPRPPQQNITLFAGEGRIHFGVEGLRYGSLVDVILEAWLGSRKLGEDRVRLRVAPFILLAPSQPVARGSLRSVYVEDLGEDNATLRASLRAIYAANLAETNVLDRWHQDGYEIGYSQAPYGAMWVALGLPRGQVSYTKTLYGAVEEVLTLPGAPFRYDPRRMSSLNEFTRQELLGPGIGLITDFQDLPLGEADCGGNLEAIPGQPARYLYGTGMNPAILRFLEAQGVQQGLSVDTSLLAVGHVDELVSYCADGVHILVIDPEIAWALLLIAQELNPKAKMLSGIAPVMRGELTVEELVSGSSAFAELNDVRAYNLQELLAPDKLLAVKARLGIGSATSKPLAAPTNRGDVKLTRAGGLVGLMPTRKPRTFKVTFESPRRFRVAYQERGASAWVEDGQGELGHDFISRSRTAFLLAEWWEGEEAVAGDVFTFTVDPTVPWVQLPVLYRRDEQGKGVCLTPNHVNALVDGPTIITAQAHGPVVDWGRGPVDIFAYYVESELRRAGYQRIVFVDERAYHNRSGSVHCATNVLREIPAAKWWESTSQAKPSGACSPWMCRAPSPSSHQGAKR